MAGAKWVEGLAADTPAADAARVVLAARFEVVRHYLPLAAARADEDVEFVHQLRVGTRRAAAALRAFAGCLPRKHLRRAKNGLRGLRRAAGDARDWDVFLLGLTEAREQGVADDDRPALDFLTGYALGERAAAQLRLAAAADEVGAEYLADTTLLPSRARPPKGEDVPRTFGQLADEQLGRLFGAFRAAVEANPERPHDLHRLRILGKRLRYALEIFAGCHAPSLRGEVYPAVERLQEVLGRVQDAAVGAERLAALRDRVRRVVPDEWDRLRPGFDDLTARHEAATAGGPVALGAWRAEWDRVTAAHPLEPPRPG